MDSEPGCRCFPCVTLCNYRIETLKTISTYTDEHRAKTAKQELTRRDVWK